MHAVTLTDQPRARSALRTGRHGLSPAQQAILGLLVGHNKRYAYIADLLDIEFDALRERAHDAVSQLIGWEPLHAFDELLIDNALGQLPAGESDAVAVHLRHHAADRSVDARIAAALDVVASRSKRLALPSGTSAPVDVERPAPLVRDQERWSRRATVPTPNSRTVTLLSLGLSLIAAGSLLLLNGMH